MGMLGCVEIWLVIFKFDMVEEILIFDLVDMMVSGFFCDILVGWIVVEIYVLL